MKQSRAFLVGLGLALALLLSTGCATYRLQPQSPVDDGHTHEHTAHALFWGLLQDTIPAACGKGIAKVHVVRSFFYDLASVLTLGIWQPIEIVYWCDPGGSRDGGGIGGGGR